MVTHRHLLAWTLAVSLAGWFAAAFMVSLAHERFGPSVEESFRTGAEPFYVLVVSDDITCGGGQPIVWEHPVPSKTTLQAVLQHQRRLGNQYGTTFIAECRIIPELTNDA